MPTEIPWNYVVSSNIDHWRYDPDTKVLEIVFVTNPNDTYYYDDVPSDVIDGFRTAASIGRYFFQNIKNRYRFYRG